MEGTNALHPQRVRSLVGDVPPVAHITIGLFICCVITHLCALRLLCTGTIRPLVCTAMCTVSTFAVFTPMHDAAHGSIATVGSGLRSLNVLIGTLSGLCFPAPFYAFKYIHLLHHKHTNDPENDPDNYAGTGPWFLLPLRWMTIEVKYYTLYLPKLLSFERPAFEAVTSLAILSFYLFGSAYLINYGYAKEVIFGWILPGRLAMFLLAFAFDYLPHRPHAVLKTESEYAATSVTSIAYDWTSPLTYPLLFQNYHNIHHLAPYVPFYYYADLWHATQSELLAKGTEIKPIIGGGNSLIQTMRMAGRDRSKKD